MLKKLILENFFTQQKVAKRKDKFCQKNNLWSGAESELLVKISENWKSNIAPNNKFAIWHTISKLTTEELYREHCLNVVDQNSRDQYQKYRDFGCGLLTAFILAYKYPEGAWSDSYDIQSLVRTHYFYSFTYWINYGLKISIKYFTKFRKWLWKFLNEPFVIAIFAFLGAVIVAKFDMILDWFNK